MDNFDLPLEKFLSPITTNKNLNFKFVTSFSSDEHVLVYLNGTESISELYYIDILFASKTNNIDFNKVLKKPAYVEFFSKEKEKKYLSGIISKLAQNTPIQTNIFTTLYRAQLVPSIYLLTLNKNYVFYQNKTSAEIIKDVLKKNNITNFEFQANNLKFRKRETCIQYNESDYDFIKRLMLEDGMFFFFKHEKNKEILVISDNNKSFYNSNEKIFVLNLQGNLSKTNIKKKQASLCFLEESILTGKYLINNYDYNKPKTNLKSEAKVKDTKTVFGTIYNYETNFINNTDGKNLVKLRADAIEYQKQFLYIRSNTIIHPGMYFSLNEHTIKKYNTDYVVSKINHTFRFNNTDIISYISKITSFNKQFVYREQYVCNKPKIHGYLSAIVTGPDNQVVFRDDLGRIKIRFLWDLDGIKNKEKSSGWVRVAETFAGSNFGSIFIPRIGQEVIVTFLNGDPDLPLVIGALYNGNNKPPYKDSDISCIKTQTFKNPKGFNELKFCDKKNQEELYMRAEKNFVFLINENSTTTLKKGNYTLKLEKGNVVIDVKGAINVKATKDISFKTNSSIIFDAKKNISFSATGKFTAKSVNAMTLDTKNKLDAKSVMGISLDSKMTISLKATMSATIQANTAVNIKSNLMLSLDGTMVNIKAKALNKIGGMLINIG